MNKMDLIKQNMGKRKEKTLDALSDNLIRSKSASVALAQIRLNPKNAAAAEDSAEDVRRLADDIATVGLLHNLVVNQTGENEYVLISGERRYKALQQLGWTHAPCVVYDNLPDAMIGAMTVLANIDAREYSAAKRLLLYQELDTQLRELKRLGIYRGGIGRGIAQMMGVGEKQIVKYKRLVEELSPAELSQVTNINKTYQEIKDTSLEEKTSPEVKFSSSEVSQETSIRSTKTSPEVKFSVPEVSQEAPIRLAKTSPQVKFSDSKSSQSHNSQAMRKPISKITEEPTQLTLDGTPEAAPAEDSAEVKQPTAYPITAQEMTIDYGGISFLCAFGNHAGGGWIAILNFGVSAELSDDDVRYNAIKIQAALAKDAWMVEGEKLNEAANYIAKIVTERIGGN